MPGNTEYPPQFSDSSLSGVLGDINDFAGSDDFGGDGGGFFAAPLAAKAAAVTAPTPVFVTGIAGPTQEKLAGLREAMIASTIIRLAAQLPTDSLHKDSLRELGLKIYADGGAKISAYARKAAKSTKKK